MTTLRERRHTELVAQHTKAVQARENAIRTLVRTERRLAEIAGKLRRYAKAAIIETVQAITPEPMPAPPAYVPNASMAAQVDAVLTGESTDQLAIPAFLARSKEGDRKDAEARAEIERQQAERKTAKARNRISAMKAKQAGDMKRMPLSGRAALAAIRNG